MGLVLINAMVSGHSKIFLWPETELIDSRIILIVAAGTIIFALQFINHFLNVRSHFPRLWKASVWIMILIIPPAIAEFLGLALGVANGILPVVILVLGNLGIFYYLGVSIASYRTGIKQARFVIVAFSAFSIGFYFYQTFLLQGAEPDIFLIHMLELGILAEGLLLSLALADRINLLSQQKEMAEREALLHQRDFSKKLIQAQEVEREKFSSALHDSIGHGVLVLKQNLTSLANDCLTNKGGRAGVNVAQKTAREIDLQANYCSEILTEVRQMSHDLHPHLLTRLGFKSAIQETMTRAFAAQDIHWQMDVDETPVEIDSERKNLIYRAIQESFNNILKHAHATEVILSLRVDQDKILVNIKDDGRGFDDKVFPDSLGINNMRDRLKLFGGHLSIHSTPNIGTHLTISVPTV